MELTDLLGVAASAASGGLLGFVGGLARQGLDWLKRRSELAQELEILKERNRHEAELRDKDREILKLEGENALKVETVKGDAAVEEARMDAIAQSFAADKATFATGAEAANSAWFIFVDTVRGLIRPAITLFFDVALLVLWGLLIWLLWDYLKPLFIARDQGVVKPMMDMLLEITKAIVFLALSCTSYWFVARPHQETKANG